VIFNFFGVIYTLFTLHLKKGGGEGEIASSVRGSTTNYFFFLANKCCL